MTVYSSDLKNFFEPHSVALVGVSSRTGQGTFNILEVLLESGFRGDIYPVNPRGGEILGQRVYPSVSDIPATPDLAVIAIPRGAVAAALQECVGKGIKAVIVITQGFADADEAGGRLQKELLAIVEGTGTRVVGPNTLGVTNFFKDFLTSFIFFDHQVSGCGVVCQSGIFLAASLDFSAGLGLGIDIGNACDVGFNEALSYLAQNLGTKVINLHMEGIQNGRGFLEAAGEASRQKPVLCYKTGRSEAGARAAGSHSGSLAGEDHVFDAAFRQCGVIRLRDTEDMRYLNKTFLAYPGMSGPRVGVVTISGGAGIASVDALNDHGLEIATFSPETLKILNDFSPDWMDVSNPADIWPAGMSKGYKFILEQSLEAVLSDPGVDACICVTPAYRDPDGGPLDVSQIIKACGRRHPDKPLAAWVLGSSRPKFTALLEAEGSIVVYPSPERAARSLGALYHYHSAIRPRPVELPQTFGDVAPDAAADIIARALNSGITTINQPALDILGHYGIPAVPTAKATNLEEAQAAAKEAGYPVAIKIESPQISHKSDVGGVRLDIKSPEELSGAYGEMMKTVQAKAPDALLEGVLVQPYRPHGVEVILGAKRDPEFGPVLVFGLGGIYTELFKDVSFRIAPISKGQALEMIKETKCYHLLSGYRGSPAADIESLAQCLQRLGQMLCQHPEIQELDINPLLISPEGVLALDARAVIAGQS